MRVRARRCPFGIGIFRGAGELKAIEIPVSVPPVAPDTNRPVRPPGIWGRKNAGRAAPCLCCRAPMRLRRFDSEQIAVMVLSTAKARVLLRPARVKQP